MSIKTEARASGKPKAMARVQKPVAISVSLLPANPASAIHAASSANWASSILPSALASACPRLAAGARLGVAEAAERLLDLGQAQGSSIVAGVL